MDKLRAQAAAQGGRVLSLLGNHEWMNAIGTSIVVSLFFSNALMLQATGGKTLLWSLLTRRLNPLFLRYVYPSEIETFGGVEKRQKMISTGRIGRTWAANYTTALRLPLHPSMGPPNTPYPFTLNESAADSSDNIDRDEFHPLSHAALSFVHGGLSPTYSNLSPFPTRINELSAALLRKLQHRKQPPPHPPHPYPGLPPSKSICVSLS